MSIIISGTCGKAKAWKAHLSLEGINVILLNSNPFLLPLRLFYKAIRENVSVFVFRYLNDYSSLFKSALVFVCFVATLVLCRAFNIRVVWLCHNINSETNNHFECRKRGTFSGIIGKAFPQSTNFFTRYTLKKTCLC